MALQARELLAHHLGPFGVVRHRRGALGAGVLAVQGVRELVHDDVDRVAGQCRLDVGPRQHHLPRPVFADPFVRLVVDQLQSFFGQRLVHRRHEEGIGVDQHLVHGREQRRLLCMCLESQQAGIAGDESALTIRQLQAGAGDESLLSQESLHLLLPARPLFRIEPIDLRRGERQLEWNRHGFGLCRAPTAPHQHHDNESDQRDGEVDRAGSYSFHSLKVFSFTPGGACVCSGLRRVRSQ